MGIAKIKIQILPDELFPQNINLMMSRQLIQTLGIPKNAPIWITFGSAVEIGYATTDLDNSKCLKICSQLASKLKLRDISSLYAHFHPVSRRLRLGPILGILINPTPIQNKPNFGSQEKFLEECCLAGIQRGTHVVIFPPKQNLESHSIAGWTYEKGKWTLLQSPFPDAIYNRILSRRQEQATSVQMILEHLSKGHNIPIFNEKFLNKLEVYHVLSQDESTKTMLPETYKFQKPLLKPMLQKYRTLFLKPTNGSLGGGIIRISRSNKAWIVQSTTTSGTTTRTFKKYSHLAEAITQRIGKHPYLIQQGLYLVKYQNRPVDFRVLVQKNRKGKWAITSSVGRIANNQEIVSNIARGGTIRRASDLLAELDINTKPSIQRLQKAALQIAEAFEQKADGHFAELGIDLGVDLNGQIWLIEINSKPSKSDDTVVISPSTTIRPSVVRLIDYTLFLSGISQTRTPNQKVSKRRKRR